MAMSIGIKFLKKDITFEQIDFDRTLFNPSITLEKTVCHKVNLELGINFKFAPCTLVIFTLYCKQKPSTEIIALYARFPIT